ncbi:MAG TPA: LysE family transporter [Dongiaceae bacterium]|nr:LysE family transporter [Dongiaceae bacterium]
MTEPVAFILAVIALLATPGPTNTLLLTAGSTKGIRALQLIPAEISGYLISILTIGYVVAKLFSESYMITAGLRAVAAAYLFFLAIQLWRRSPTMLVQRRLISFRDVFVTTLLNPKALLFATGIIPLNDPQAATYLLAFCLLVSVIGSAWITVGVIVARGFLVKAHISLLPRVSAVVLAGFASYLVALQFR